MICLPPTETNKFLDGLKSGKIDPERLSKMTSEERHAALEKFVGKDFAAHVNSTFESKMLLKNQQRGYLTWAKSTAGLTEPAKRDIISRIQRMDKVLNPEEEKAFLKDLASTKLGVNVTAEEAKTIAGFAKKVGDLQPKASTVEQSLQKGFKLSKHDVEIGRARYDMQKYISDLKSSASRTTLRDFHGKGIIGGTGHILHQVADISKSIGASLDDSFALRQGAKTFWTNNKAWRHEFIQSFANIARALKNTEAANREFHAHLMGDPAYDQAVKDGLALTRNEDVFPTSLPEKIPVFGRAFGASEVAYNAFAQNLRLNLYKQEMRLAKGVGEDVPKDYGKNMAKMVNSLTGRGSFGAAEPLAGHLNIAFYSLRFLKSNVDTLLLHPLGFGVNRAAQKKAAINLAKIIAGTAATLAVADKLKPGSVDFDPRSANFGKIKIGNTRFDVSGGMGSIVTLAAQLKTQSEKSATTGKITKFSAGVMGTNNVDVVLKFLENKASPVGGVALDYANKQTHQGTKPSARYEAGQLFTPLGVKNYQELKSSPNSANVLAAVLADAFGISANTYGQSQKDWSNSPSMTKAVEGFQKKVSPADFKKANQQYNQLMTIRQQKLTSSSTYQGYSDSQKQAALNKLQAQTQAEVMKKYNYTYKAAKPDKQFNSSEKALLQSIK